MYAKEKVKENSNVIDIINFYKSWIELFACIGYYLVYHLYYFIIYY